MTKLPDLITHYKSKLLTLCTHEQLMGLDQTAKDVREGLQPIERELVSTIFTTKDLEVYKQLLSNLVLAELDSAGFIKTKQAVSPLDMANEEVTKFESNFMKPYTQKQKIKDMEI